jgi:hypothetical protein
MMSGPPVNLSVQGNPSNTGGTDRPNVVHDRHLSGSQRTLDRWFDTTAFLAAAPFTFGDAGRNLLEGRGTVNFDFALRKDFGFPGGRHLQFRCETFDGFNTPRFSPPSAQVGVSAFGKISSASTPRNLQFGLEFVF